MFCIALSPFYSQFSAQSFIESRICVLVMSFAVIPNDAHLAFLQNYHNWYMSIKDFCSGLFCLTAFMPQQHCLVCPQSWKPILNLLVLPIRIVSNHFIFVLNYWKLSSKFQVTTLILNHIKNSFDRPYISISPCQYLETLHHLYYIHSRTSKTNMAKVRRKAEIEIFKLEREREINYVKAKSEHHNSTDKLNDQSDTASVASAKTDGEWWLPTWKH